MKIKEIEELIDFINQSGLEEVDIETEQIKLRVKRSGAGLQKAPGPILGASPIVFNDTPTTQPIQAVLPTNKPSQADQYITIKSPMIGTFYRAASPDAAPFVKEGQVIGQNQTVCVIEAMKLFNEIESDVAGTIVKILVEDASPVEYDQALFWIKPA
jgi:acetyl-CoA carboxylase biotin carboxyl carrier protein